MSAQPVPEWSPEWPPSTDQLARITNSTHWQLEELGYDLRRRPHLTRDGRLVRIAADLDALAHLLRQHAGTEPRTGGQR